MSFNFKKPMGVCHSATDGDKAAMAAGLVSSHMVPKRHSESCSSHQNGPHYLAHYLLHALLRIALNKNNFNHTEISHLAVGEGAPAERGGRGHSLGGHGQRAP